MIYPKGVSGGALKSRFGALYQGPAHNICDFLTKKMSKSDCSSKVKSYIYYCKTTFSRWFVSVIFIIVGLKVVISFVDDWEVEI